jgi:D-aminopeptidase
MKENTRNEQHVSDSGTREPSNRPRSDGGRIRLRDLGIAIGRYTPGRYNAITDVPGVQVGHSTLIQGSGRLRTGKGPVRTGVTAILPNRGNIFYDRLAGGGFVLNGAGEVSGLTQVFEWGLIETPILLTNTLSVGTCSHGLVRYMVDKYPGLGREYDVVIPLVGECDDSWLNDIRGRHVRPEHVYEAVNNASSGPVAEGNVGGGTGMITCDLKGGIGTSSRKLPPSRGGYTLGVIVMSNFGRMEDLRIDGIPIGRILEPRFREQKKRRNIYGSIIVVVATDAPLISLQLSRLSTRAALGIGRVGSYASHQSGEIILAFATANVFSRHSRSRTYVHTMLSDEHIDPLYQAAIEATEEAILNAIFMAEDMFGINDHFAAALPIDEVREILTRYHVDQS